MTTPSFQESHISQIPALQLLQKLGYTYLTPGETEQQRKISNVLLEDILREHLKRINKFTYKGQERSFTDEAITKAIEALRDIPRNEGLGLTSARVYDLLTLGKSVEQTVDGETKGYTIRYIDWENPRNNAFHVTAEFEVERVGSYDRRRPDIVCFVNGIPFIVIECKCPQDKDSMLAAVQQNIRNWEPNQIPHLYHYAQLVMGLNKNEGKYATTGTPENFWATWKELKRDSMEKELEVIVNQPAEIKGHNKLFDGIFGYAKTYFEELATAPRQVTGQDSAVYSLCRPDRLIELARQFIIFDEGGTLKKIARYQQYFAVKETIERVHQRDSRGGRKGGVVWHTQGSGKSLTMVMLGKALALDSTIKNPRIVLVTDRIDLDDQIKKTFMQCGKEPQQAKTGRNLIELLANDNVSIITTVVDKFETAAKGTEQFVNTGTDIFVLVDESHRSHYGETSMMMRKALPNACFIGFTGTPLMKKEKNTALTFGGFIEPKYTIRDAVEDKAVVPLLYEGRHILQEVNKKAVDQMFDAMSEGLTTEQQADLKRKFASKDTLNQLESKLQLIAWDISQHYAKTWKDTGFKGQVTALGKREALILKRYLDLYGKVTSEVLISGPDEREGSGDASDDANVQRFWQEMMTKYGNEKEYNRSLIKSFKDGESPEIIIVVDKLLTGFDAPKNVVLYIARSLKDHTLLQAIARVNRLCNGKDYGYIIDYYGVITNLHSALELYGSLGDFDPEDLEGTLDDIAHEVKKLPALHDELWRIFSAVKNKKDEEEFERLLSDKEKRETFGLKLSQFSRCLRMGLSSLTWLQSVKQEKIEEYKRDAVFFQKLRVASKLRYAEGIDYRNYEKQIQKMLSTYVQSNEVIRVVEPVNIFEKAAFEAEVDKAKTPRAKADTIINRTKKTITEKMDEDPFFYRKFSKLLQDTIDEYTQARISEAELLKRVTEIMERVRDGRHDDTPSSLAKSDLAKAFYGIMREIIPADAVQDEPLALLVLKIEESILKNKIIRWRESIDAQNKMKNGVDDLLYAAQKDGVSLSLSQMDLIIEGCMKIAKNRPQDVE